MTGKDICALSREEFCGRAHSFVADILWEHLVLLQQEVDRDVAALKNVLSNLSERLRIQCSGRNSPGKDNIT